MKTERCSQGVRITVMSFLIISWSQRGSRHDLTSPRSFVKLGGSDSWPRALCSWGIFILWMSMKRIVPCNWTEWHIWNTVCFFQEDPPQTQSWSPALVASDAGRQWAENVLVAVRVAARGWKYASQHASEGDGDRLTALWIYYLIKHHQ